MQCKIVMVNLFTVVGYPVEPNSKYILEANTSTETYLSIRQSHITVTSDSPFIPSSLSSFFFDVGTLRSNSSTDRRSG